MKARPIWIVSILFTILGFLLPFVGVRWNPLLMVVGVPFAMLGWLLLGLASYGLRLKHSDPDRYPAWSWWIDLIGGISGAAIFAIPALFVFPMFLLIGMTEHLLLGALFTLLGLGVGVATLLVAAHMIRHRPREFGRPEVPDSQWETEAYRQWLEGSQDDAPPEATDRDVS